MRHVETLFSKGKVENREPQTPYGESPAISDAQVFDDGRPPRQNQTKLFHEENYYLLNVDLQLQQFLL